MKGDIILGVVFLIAVLLIPLSAVNLERANTAEGSFLTSSPKSESKSSGLKNTDKAEKTPVEPTKIVKDFKILDSSTGKVFTMSAKDFIRGAVAAEMPASYEPEALKAQAVAAYTYAVRQSMVQKENPSSELKGADFCADPKNYKVCIDKDIAKDFYGENFDVLWTKVCKAADSVYGKVLTKDGLPIAAAYHAISCGKTETAENIWGSSLPCITMVDSEWDVYAPEYASQEVFSKTKLMQLLVDTYPDIKLGTNPETWFEVLERSESNYITKIRAGDKEIKGQDLRTLLGLRSSCFDIKFLGGNFIFDVKGYGHGAGLSQYGADYMARQGSSYEDILQHYYPGSQLTEMK